MRLNKKGDYFHNVLLTLILGLLLVSIIYYFIYEEYFTDEELDLEICREAIILRNSLPEEQVAATVVSTKSLIPLKCSTNALTIDYENVTKAEKEIGELIAQSWYMVGMGDYTVFPSLASIEVAIEGGLDVSFSSQDTPCMIPSRIHMTEEVKEYYRENVISIEDALGMELEGYGVTIWDYLTEEGGSNAMKYFNDWDDDGFNITYVIMSIEEFEGDDYDGSFNLPRYFDADRGDLYIIYGEPVRETANTDDRKVDPYLFFLQYSDFDKLSYNLIWLAETSIPKSLVNKLNNKCDNCFKVCSSIETIPG